MILLTFRSGSTVQQLHPDFDTPRLREVYLRACRQKSKTFTTFSSTLESVINNHEQLYRDVLQGPGQFDACKRQPGRRRKCWVEQVTTSTGLSPSDAWSVAADQSTWRTLRPVDGQA